MIAACGHINIEAKTDTASRYSHHISMRRHSLWLAAVIAIVVLNKPKSGFITICSNLNILYSRRTYDALHNPGRCIAELGLLGVGDDLMSS